MPLTTDQINAIKAIRKPRVAAYLKVVWDENDSTQTRYYADRCYDQLAGFQAIGVKIEARMLENIIQDIEFDLNPDIKTVTIPLSFSDIPDENGVKPISSRFQTYKSGVYCEIFYYWADINVTESKWFGQLQAPQVRGHKTIQPVGSNGFINRTQLVPGRRKGDECPATYGKKVTTMFALETNLCYVDIHLGGTTGNPGFDDCPRLSRTGDCGPRITPPSPNGYQFAGYELNAAATVTNTQGYIATSRENTSSKKVPIRVIAGSKYVRGNWLLEWRRRLGSPNPEHNWVDSIWEVCEGTVLRVYGVKVIEKFIEAPYVDVRTGERGQPSHFYASVMNNYSATVTVHTQYGWVNALSISERDLRMECRVDGDKRVAVFTDATTYARQWTDDRVWWLMHVYAHQTWGLRNDKSRFEIADWITASQWSRDTVEFTAYYPDGEEEVHSGRRTTFDAILEPRAAFEQIDDICRSGAISIPFQHNGKYTVTPFRPATEEELDEAPVFTDSGPTKNIEWANGQPSIQISYIPDDQLINEIVLTFEEATNTDIERPITVDDPDQQVKAGRFLGLGLNTKHPVPARMSAFGCRHLQEVVRLGNRELRFGKYDEGGTQNNLRLVFYVPLKHANGLKRYQIVKVVSSLLDDEEIGTVIAGQDYREEPEWFRILNLRKVKNGWVELTVQAYNRTAYEAFETVTAAGTGSPASAPVGPPPPPPPPCELTFASTPTYDDVTGTLSVPINPC